MDDGSEYDSARLTHIQSTAGEIPPLLSMCSAESIQTTHLRSVNTAEKY